jgi:hypothetical protein
MGETRVGHTGRVRGGESTESGSPFGSASAKAPVETDTALARKCSSKLTRGWPVWRRNIRILSLMG